MRAPRVLLVREWRGTTSGGGCCSAGVAPGDLFGPAHGRPDSDGGLNRACRQGFGEVYRHLRRECPDADVTVVDSRNWLWLLPAVVGDARRAGLGRREAWREAVRATTPASVVVDGVVVVQGRVPDAREVVDVVRGRDGGRAAAARV